MDWIKRNLFFVIGGVVSLALLVFAGYYNYTGWQHKVKEGDTLDGKYAELKRLYEQKPHPGHPGFGKVNNIELAREQQKEIRQVLAKAANYFQAPPAIPSPINTTNITSSQFTAALRETVNQLSRTAAAASVQLPPDFKFSFSQQLRLLTFAPGSLEPLAVQLGEVKALCDVLIKAKVNSLDGLQRERVSPDDAVGPQTDYIDSTSQTNDLAVLTPYQITFRSFSHEIAQVLAGFANAPHGFIVQSINVEPAAATAQDQPGAAPAPAATYMPVPAAPITRAGPRNVMDEEAREAAMLRPDLFKYTGPSATPRAAPPAYVTPPGYTAAPTTRAGSQTALNERQLRVTLLVQVVKLLPKK
jgi:hypothetical protein